MLVVAPSGRMPPRGTTIVWSRIVGRMARPSTVRPVIRSRPVWRRRCSARSGRSARPTGCGPPSARPPRSNGHRRTVSDARRRSPRVARARPTDRARHDRSSRPRGARYGPSGVGTGNESDRQGATAAIARIRVPGVPSRQVTPTGTPRPGRAPGVDSARPTPACGAGPGRAAPRRSRRPDRGAPRRSTRPRPRADRLVAGRDRGQGDRLLEDRAPAEAGHPAELARRSGRRAGRLRARDDRRGGRREAPGIVEGDDVVPDSSIPTRRRAGPPAAARRRGRASRRSRPWPGRPVDRARSRTASRPGRSSSRGGRSCSRPRGGSDPPRDGRRRGRSSRPAGSRTACPPQGARRRRRPPGRRGSTARSPGHRCSRSG